MLSKEFNVAADSGIDKCDRCGTPFMVGDLAYAFPRRKGDWVVCRGCQGHAVTAILTHRDLKGAIVLE